MKKKLLFMPFAALCLYGTALAQTKPPSQKDYGILHVNGRKAPPAASARQARTITPEVFGKDQYYLVQLYDIPDEARKSQLLQQGIELLEYFPNYAYYAWFSKDIPLESLEQRQIRTVLRLDSSLKLSPELLSGNYPAYALHNGVLQLDVTVFAKADMIAVADRLSKAGMSVKPLEPGSRILHIGAPVMLLQALITEPQVQYIAPTPPAPTPEFDQNNFGRSNVINSGFNGLSYNGKGITTMVRESDGVNDNIDFGGRLDVRTAEPGDITSHATGCADRLGNAGNTDPSKRSNAWGANILSMGGGNLFTMYDDPSLRLRIVNMSYGWGTDAGYNGESSDHDRLMRTRPEAMLVYSSGNSGTAVTNGGKYNGIAGWGNLTGNPKHAKNLLVVSGTNYEDVFYTWTCSGPAYDGRVKPELSIEGSEGTSFAAPKVAGIMAVLYDAFKTETGSAAVRSGLIKGILMNTADDIHNPGIDFKTGYGRPNVRRAYQVIKQRQFLTDSLANLGTKNFTIPVPAGVKQLRVMLYWADYEAAPGAAKALVNDLDLRVTDPGSNVTLPWVLDTTANPVNLNLPPTRNEDHINNTEQVTIDDPVAGNYTVNVSGYQVPQGVQEFYIVYELVKDAVLMSFPIGGESLVPGAQEYIRWDAYGNTSTFDLEYSTNAGGSWNTIATGLAAASRAYKWTVPATAAKYLIRVKRGTQADTTKTFNIFPVPANLKVDWACADQMQLRWNKTPQTQEYEVFRMGAKYMEPVGRTSDTVMMISADSSKAEWVAVRAIGINGEEGLRSNAVQKEKGTYRCNSLYSGIALNVRRDSALLTGSVNPHGQAITNLAMEYGATTAYGSQVSIPGTYTGVNDIAVQQDVPIALTGSEAWHFRIKGELNGTVVYGDDRLFQAAPGFSLKFTGSEAAVLGSNTPIDGAKSRTVAVWAKADAFTDGGIFSTGATGTTYTEFSFRTIPTDNVWRAQFWNNNKDFTLPNSKGEWHHYALTFNGTNVSFYYDGALQSTWAAALNTKNGNFNLGIWNGNKFQGEIDEVSVWNAALSADQVRKLMHHHLKGNEPNLVYYANFDNFETESYELVNRKEIVTSGTPAKVKTFFPAGPGMTATGTESASGLSLANASIAYNAQNAAQVAVSNISLGNYTNKGLPGTYTALSKGYWTTHRYGTGNLGMNITLKVDQPLTGITPSKVILMGKDPYSAGKWRFIALAASLDTTAGTVTFNNLNEYTQLLPLSVDSAFLTSTQDSLRLTDARTGVTTAPAVFSLSGVNIGDSVKVTAPAGYLVSLWADSVYRSSLSFAPTSGLVKDVKVYTRFSPATAGIYAGDIQMRVGDSVMTKVAVRQQGVTPETSAGKAMSFSGNADYLEIENLNWKPTEFTIEWWLKARSFKNYNQSIGNGWGSFLVHADATKAYNIGVANNAASRMKIDSAFADLNTWHHYAYTFSNGAAKIYRDGVLMDSKTASTYPPTWSTFRIGSADGNTIDGEMEEFRMWSTARTQQEIRENMHLTLQGNESGLKLYLQFQDTEKGVADLSNNAYSVRKGGSPVRVNSAVPVASGISQTKTINATGYTLFEKTNIGLNFDNGTTPDGEVVISKLSAPPDGTVSPAPLGGVYWVINNFGNNRNYTGLKQLRIDSLHQLGDDTTMGGIYSAYGRRFNDVGNTWTLKAKSSAVLNDQLVFSPDSAAGWTATGQFVLNKLATAAPDTLAGTAFRFNGTPGYLDVQNLNWKPTSFTIEWWIKANSAKNYNQSIGNGWGSFLVHAGSGKDMSIGVANNSNSRMNVPGAFNEPGTWHHYAYTFSNGAAKIYRDGVLIDSRPASAMPPQWNNFRIGSNDGNTLDGDLDEFRMWSVARTEQEIRENMHHTLQGNEAGLKLYLQCHGAMPGYITDVTGNHYVISINGSVASVASTVPVAKGVSQTLSASGTLNFDQAGLQLDMDSAATVMVSRLNTQPDGPLNARPYWIVHQFDGGRQLTALRQVNLAAPDTAWNYNLHRRSFNAFGDSWDSVTTAGFRDSDLVRFSIDTVWKGSRQLVVTTSPNAAPETAINQPVNLAYYELGTDVSITATAADTDGWVKKVEFFAGAEKIGEATASPYAITWKPGTDGSFALRTRVTDNAGASRLSDTVGIVVSKHTVGGTPHSALEEALRGVLIFPNPTRGWVNLIIPNVVYRTAVVRVLSTNGLVIYQQNLSESAMKVVHRIDLSAQPPGIYFVQLIIANKAVTTKVVKL